MQHGQIPRNRCPPFARCLNALLCCLLFIWQRKWLPSFGRSWHILPRGSMMTVLRISYALTTGCSPIYQELLHSSSRYNATRTGEKNRPSNGLARISAHPRPCKNWNQLLLAPDLQTGLAVLLCGYSTGVVPCPLGPCGTAPSCTELPTHLGWTRRWLRMT